MASEVGIPESLVTQAPQDAIGTLGKEKEAKNESVVEEDNNEDTDGECFLYPPSVGKVATETHRESEMAELEETLVSDSNANNLQMDSKNAASGEIEHVNKGNQETIDTNVSNHNNLLEVQAVEVPISVPNQTLEIFEKDKKSESNPETAVPLDHMALLGKVEALITEEECSVVHCSEEVAGSEETEQSEKKLTGGDEESSVDGASAVSQTAFSSVESEKELTSQSAKEVMEGIQPPESTDVEEKVCLQQVGEDIIRSEEESSPLFEETDEELKEELTVKNTNAESNDDHDMGLDEPKTDTEVTTEENLKENSYELISNNHESLQKEEQHLGLVPACSEKEISSELIHAEECIEKQAIKQTETEKKCEEETVTTISDDILADETTTATEEGEMESFVADSEIQEKEVDNFNASGVPEDNTLETDTKEMNSPENISKNENDISLGHNEAVDSLEKEAQSREKQEAEHPFEEETHISNASEEVKTPQPAALEGSLVETETSKDLYSETSIVGEKSEEMLISGDGKKLEDDDGDECRNLPVEKEQHESAISEVENTHEVSKNTMPDSNAPELVGSLQDKKLEGKSEDSERHETAEDNMEGQKSVEETSNPEGSTRPLEEPPLEKPKEVVSVQEAETCQHENDEPRELDKTSANFDEVTNEENNSETPNTTKEEGTDILGKEENIVKEITEEASECLNTTQESTEKVEAEISQVEGISNIQKETSEDDNASNNQITDAEKAITESTSAADIVVEEKDMDVDVVNGTKSTGSENDVIVTENIAKVHELDEIIDKEMVTSEEYTSEESVDKHTEDEKRNTIQETDQKTEDVTDNIPEDFGQVSATDLDILTTEGRTSIDENPWTEKERTNQEDHLNESTLEVDVEDNNISESSNIKGQGCTPVVVVSDKPEAVEDDAVISETFGDANAEGELKQVTSVNVEAVGKAIDAKDTISKHEDAANISNDGLEALKGKGKVSDGDNYYQEKEGPVSDEVCMKENTEPDNAIEKSESCSDSAATSKIRTSAEPNKPGTDENQDVEHEDEEPAMNSHLEEIEVEVKDSANIEEVGKKAREADLDETRIIEREVEEDVPYIEAEKADDEDKLETVQEDSSQHCDELDTTESDNNELPKDGQEKEQVRFDDIHGTNLVEDAEIGTYRSEENSNEMEIKETVEKPIHQAESFSTFNDIQQVFEEQDEANKELESVKDENSNSFIDVVSAKEISESVVDPSEHLSQEVHKEKGLSATGVVTEIKDEESANDEGNLNKIIDAVEVEKLECGTESSNVTDPNNDETDATGRTLNVPVANCAENVIVDGREAKTLNAEVPEINLAKCSLEKVEDETQSTDEKSQVSEGDTKEEDFQQATVEERIEIELENESHTCISDDKHVHESKKMSELHKSDEMGGPHSGTDETIAEESFVPNNSSVEVQNHQISTVVEASGGNIDEKMAVLDQEESHEPTYDVSETKIGISSQDVEVKEKQEYDRDEIEDKNAEASAFDVTDDKTEEGQQGTHCDDITNKTETVMEGKKNNLSEEPGVSREVTKLETTQISEVTRLLEEEDTMASELGIPPLGNVSSTSDVNDDLSNEVGAPNGDKISEECVPTDENQSLVDVSNLNFDNQQVDAEEGCGRTACETETVNVEVKETSPVSGSSVTEKVSEGCEPIQDSPLQEDIVKEDIEEQKVGEINGEIACKPEIMKVEFKDDMPEETNAKTDESEPLEESQLSKDVPVSKFNTPTDVEDNLVMETGGSVPPNVSTECLDSQECHSKFDILNGEDIADTQEEISTETACEAKTLYGEIKDDLPEEPDSLSVEKASEGMPSQEDQSLNDVLNSDVDVPKEEDQEVKGNDFDEAACETKTAQAQVNNDLLKEGASDVEEVKADLPDEPDSLSEVASIGKSQPNGVDSSGFEIPEEDEKQKGHDSNDISCGVAPLHAQVTDDLLTEPDVSDDADGAKMSEECADLEENQSSKDVLDSKFDVTEDETKEAEKHGEVCTEIGYKTNTVDVGNKGDLSDETNTIVNEETSSQEIGKVVDVDTTKADENVKEKTSEEEIEQSSSLKIEHEHEAKDAGEKEANVQVADETERQVDDSNVDSEQSMDMKQVQEVDITGITDKSSMGEARESPLEFEVGNNQPSNNSESIINSLTQETTTETDHSEENLMVDRIDGVDKSPTSISAMLSKEPEELSAADIIANQISLDIEREEQQKQLSSQKLQEQEATVVGSDTLDTDNHALKGNTVAMNFDEITRMSCLPKDGQAELGVLDSECRLDETEHKTISRELVAEIENTMTPEADKATTCDAENHEEDMGQASREESKAQSHREDGQNTEISPEDDEKQHILAKASEIPEEKVLSHDPEAAPQDSQNESSDSYENAVTAGEQDTDNQVNLSSAVSQMDEEDIKDSDILHTPEVQEQPLEEKGTIESTDNAVTSGEQDRGSEVNLSSIASQKDEEATKICIGPHMPQVQEQMPDQKGVSMEDDKDKDLHETRKMEDTGNDHDDTIRSTLIVDKEKLLENHCSTHEKGQIEADATKSVPAEQDQSGSCPTENTVKETSPMAGGENFSTGRDKIDEKGFSEPKGEQTNDTKTGSIKADSTNISVSDIMQRSSAQPCETDEEKHIIPEEKTPDKEDAAVEEVQTDEEGDVDKAQLITEGMRDFDIRASNRKSHNILSGVGSKVKHSISKVKKAITCSSSQFASDDVFVKLNKNKKI